MKLIDVFRVVGFFVLAFVIAAPFILNFEGVTEIRLRKNQKIGFRDRVKMSIPAYDANLSRTLSTSSSKVEKILLDAVQSKNI